MSFFGISLVPEKEMPLIVARNELYPAILSRPFSEPAAGIISHSCYRRVHPNVLQLRLRLPLNGRAKPPCVPGAFHA